MAGRSHNVAAQATTLGKRFATVGRRAARRARPARRPDRALPAARHQGPGRHAQDMLDLLDGDAGEAGPARGRRSPQHLGFATSLTSVGQVYPRSLDYDVLTALVQLAAAPSSLAKTIRLMAGHELVTEGFQPGQVGSSAMPHKMNTRSAERINGFAVMLRGYASMVGELAGDQWNEGDVSCSVVRRVALPDAFFAMDGLLETAAHRARRVRRVPGGHRARARPLPAVPRHDEGADGRRSGRRRPRERHTRRSSRTRWRWRSRCARRAPTRNDLFDRLAADSRLGLSAADAGRAAGRADRRSPARRATRWPPSSEPSITCSPPSRPRPTTARNRFSDHMTGPGDRDGGGNYATCDLGRDEEVLDTSPRRADRRSGFLALGVVLLVGAVVAVLVAQHRAGASRRSRRPPCRPS